MRLSFGYNLHVGDGVVIHRHVLLDDRGGIEIGDGAAGRILANDIAGYGVGIQVVGASDPAIEALIYGLQRKLEGRLREARAEFRRAAELGMADAPALPAAVSAGRVPEGASAAATP